MKAEGAGQARRSPELTALPSRLLPSNSPHTEGARSLCLVRVVVRGGSNRRLPLFRPDIFQVGVDRASVLCCRRPLLVAVGCCCCCHRCCQRLVSVPLSEVSRLCGSTPVLPKPSPGPDCCRT